MRLLSLTTLVLAAACSGDIAEPPGGTADARPIGFREPPEPKEGSGTSPGCEGVTARGECQGGEAVYCDLDRGRLRRVDCEAMGQSCVVDISRGAICTSLGEEPGGGGIASACTDTGISETGFCAPDGTAIYCDTTGSEPVTRTWNCEAAGKTCGIDDCAEGAFCCGGDDVGGGGGGEENNCGELDFNGICDGEVARWCGGGEPRELDCSATGQRCEVDTCATGAFCCGEVESTGGGEADECAEIGFEGVCTPDGTVRWCSDGQIEEVTCSGERTCQEDVCITGAACCLPQEMPTNRCTEIGWDGVCKDATTVEFCAGEEESDILEFTCSGDKTCQVDVCGDGANCCDPPATCESVNNAVGICDGDTLKYCTGGEITEQDCAAEGKACEVDTCFSGFANCC